MRVSQRRRTGSDERYRRHLNLDIAIARVTYAFDGVGKRECLIAKRLRRLLRRAFPSSAR